MKRVTKQAILRLLTQVQYKYLDISIDSNHAGIQFTSADKSVVISGGRMGTREAYAWLSGFNTGIWRCPHPGPVPEATEAGQMPGTHTRISTEGGETVRVVL